MRAYLSIMISRSSLFLLLIPLLLGWVSSVQASEATSFCKCTCFSNSTIIQLGQPTDKDGGLSILDPRDVSHSPLDYRIAEGDDWKRDEDKNETDAGEGDKKEKEKDKGSSKPSDDKSFRGLTCNDCNRRLCLDHDLPKCKGAKEEDVFTTCFQRDSSKDQIVVFLFIFATAGLLLWAIVKPWAVRWFKAARERRSYLPVSAQES